MSTSITYLTGASWRGGALAPNGLPPPEIATHNLITAAGEGVGLSFTIARWDDPALLREPPQIALIRSCWDYPERVAAFIERTEALTEVGVRIINTASIVRWNARKTYLDDLSKAGVETIPTMFVDHADARAVLRAFDTFDAAELVLKPQTGAGSRETVRARRNVWSEMDLALAPRGPAMLQPYMPSIESEGERSLFYYGGRFAYAVLKHPAQGSWFANQADTIFARYEPTRTERDLAEQALSASPPGIFYARVDIVTGGAGRPALIELEAIEPRLFLEFAPEGAATFVSALADAL